MHSADRGAETAAPVDTVLLSAGDRARALAEVSAALAPGARSEQPAYSRIGLTTYWKPGRSGVVTSTLLWASASASCTVPMRVSASTSSR